MQKLLLELGGPLVIAFALLAIARFVRGIIDRIKGKDPQQDQQTEETEDHPEELPPS